MRLSEILRPGDSRFLGAFAALFIVLGLAYSTLTPIFEHSDETLHYPYVKHLADGRGLPVGKPGQLWGQEGTQPPLYYALAAALTFWIDSDNLPDLLQPNPHWLFADARAVINDNQNLVLHGPRDAFPYRRAALAIHLSRWLSLFFGLVTVICAFLIARYFFPANLPLTLSATALAAFTPQFIRVSVTVSNDSLSAALASLTVLLALKFTTPRNWISPTKYPTSLVTRHSSLVLRHSSFVTHHSSLLPPLTLGLLSGLALLTKLSSLTTFFLAAFIIFWRVFFTGETHQQPFQKMARWILIIAAITGALTGWWFVRNFRLYGEWLAIGTHLRLAGGHNPITLSEVWALRPEIERAYWATFGWGQIRPPEWVFQLLRWFARIGLVGLGLAMFARLIQGDRKRPLPFNTQNINFEQVIFLLFWAGLNLSLYFRWAMSVGSVSHTRLIFPAITAISILLALGWHAFIPRPLEAWFSGLLGVGLVTLNIYSLGWLIYPAFTPQERAERITNEINVTFLGSLKVIGGSIYAGLPAANLPPNDERQRTNVAQAGDVVTIQAQWQVLAPLDKNYSVAAVLLAPGGRVLAQRETYPGLGLHPTLYLTTGDTFTDHIPLPLTANISEPMVARAVVSLFDVDSPTRAGFPALDTAGQEVRPVVGQIKIVPKEWPRYQPDHPVNVNFAESIKLIGYDFKSQNSKPGTQNSKLKTITFYWQSQAPVNEDYNLFIHLLDAEGNIIAQADAPPTGNAYPTGWWSPGETIADTHILPNEPEATHIRLGIYSLASGRRLPVNASTLPNQIDSVEIVLP